MIIAALLFVGAFIALMAGNRNGDTTTAVYQDESYDDGYGDGWEWHPAPTHNPAPDLGYQQYGQYQQPSYIQQQPWFQQPYFAAQVPMEYRQAAFQYQNPFQATHEPVNVIW